MYQDGVAKLIDFGVATISKHSTRGTSVQGTYTWMSPEQALSDSRKTYTLCDMFSFGLIVKWLLVGVKDDVPFKDMPTDHIIREHGRLNKSEGSLLHPYVEDLSLVPPVFRLLIQFCTAADAKKRWTAPKAMWELCQLKSRLTAARVSIYTPASSGSRDAALQGGHRQRTPPPPAQAAAAARASLPLLVRNAPGAALSAQALQTTPVPAVSCADWPTLLQQLRGALTTEAVASVKYYRNMAFAANVCDELSDAEAAEGVLADAAHFAAASKKLHSIVAGQGSPTSAETLTSLLAQVNHAVPAIETAQDAAKTAKEYSKAADLQELR